MDEKSSEQQLTNALPIKGEWQPKIPHEAITILIASISGRGHRFKMLPNGIECGHAIVMWLSEDTEQGPFMELLRRTNSTSKFLKLMRDYRKRGITKSELDSNAIFRIVEMESTVLTHRPEHPLINPDDLDSKNLASAIEHGFVTETAVTLYHLVFLPLSCDMPIAIATIATTKEGMNIRDLIIESLYSLNQ